MLTQLVYILDQKKKADRMLTFVLMRSVFCRGVGVHKERLDCNVIVPYFWAHAQCYIQGFWQS